MGRSLAGDGLVVVRDNEVRGIFLSKRGKRRVGVSTINDVSLGRKAMVGGSLMGWREYKATDSKLCMRWIP
jgi:hypothetical protein